MSGCGSNQNLHQLKINPKKHACCLSRGCQCTDRWLRGTCRGADQMEIVVGNAPSALFCCRGKQERCGEQVASSHYTITIRRLWVSRQSGTVRSWLRTGVPVMGTLPGGARGMLSGIVNGSTKHMLERQKSASTLLPPTTSGKCVDNSNKEETEGWWNYMRQWSSTRGMRRAGARSLPPGRNNGQGAFLFRS
eukprot:2684985-Amphidinium_carterae.1